MFVGFCSHLDAGYVQDGLMKLFPWLDHTLQTDLFPFVRSARDGGIKLGNLIQVQVEQRV
jgi:hypothetical protein